MRHSVRFFTIVALLALIAFGAVPASAGGPTVNRPIGEFLAAQGTYCPDPCYLFVPPDPNFIGWSTNFAETPVLFAGIDYAGKAPEAYAPGHSPRINGTVTERPLADGTAEVHVQMHTWGANMWVIQLDLTGDVYAQIASGPTLFGHRPIEVAGGAGQALADVQLEAKFIIPKPGAPLPDLMEINGTPALKFLGINGSADGPLTALFDVPEGTPGKATINQKGLYVPPGAAIGSGFDYNFPVENIKLMAVGK